VVGGFFTSSGSMVGPAVAAMLVTPEGYDDVLVVAIVVYVAVLCVMALSVSIARRN
jgi:hypothetical protein